MGKTFRVEVYNIETDEVIKSFENLSERKADLRYETMTMRINDRYDVRIIQE